MPKPRLMFENDSRHTLLYMCEPPVTREGGEAAVDELLGTPIEALVFNLGFGNAFLHDTQVADHWGPETEATAQFRPEDDHLWDHLVFQRAYRNAQQLIAEGRDLLHIVCDRARAKGLMIYPSLQVQADLGEGLRIGDTQLADFVQPEVREMRFALIEETLQNYPVDGFELNLNHYAGGAFFHPDDMERGRSIFTDWLQRVREAVKQSGPDRELALRIPTSIAGCRSLGLDPETWIREGIADVLVAENFAAMSLIDATANFRPLIGAAQDAECRIHGVIRNNVDSDRLGAAPIAMIRAAATNYWAQGVDGLNLVHWAGNWPYGPSFYEQLRELPHPDVMAVKDKIYAIPTPSGRSAAQPKTEPGLVMQLPAPLSLEQPVALELPISDDLPRWGAAGRVHEVILRIRLMRATDRDRLSFKLNGDELPAHITRKIDHIYQMTAPRYRSHSSYWFVFRLDEAHWPAQGTNVVEVTLHERDPEATPLIYVRDVELEVRYLRGKSTYRGVHNTDPDLGPYECGVT